MTVAQLRARLEQTREALEKALEAEAKQALALLEDVPVMPEFTLTWTGPYKFHVHRQLPAAYCDTLEAFKCAHPGVKLPAQHNHYNPRSGGGMSYYLIGNVIASTGGGLHVLRLGNLGMHNEPTELSNDDVLTLRDGVVPQHLKWL